MESYCRTKYKEVQALKVAPREHSLANVPSRTFPRERSLRERSPRERAPREGSLAKVPLAKVPLANVPLRRFPLRTFSSPSPFTNNPSQTFSRLRRGLASSLFLPHSRACGMNADTQHDKAQQTTAKLHHTVEQSYLNMPSNAY